VTASKKVVPLFEKHIDIIVKGNRKTEYGHKIFLAGGGPKLLIDYQVEICFSLNS